MNAMNMQILWGVGISILVPFLLGYAVNQCFFRNIKMDIFIQLALAWGVGMGFIVHWILILGWMNAVLTLPLIAGPIIFVSISLLILCKIKKNSFNVNASPVFQPSCLESCSGMDKIWIYVPIVCLLMYIFFQIYYVCWNALNIPVYTWDAIYFISQKANVFFHDQSMNQIVNFPWNSYPIHVTLSQTWVAICMGIWNDQWIKVIFPITFICFSYMYFYFLRLYSNLLWSLIGLALLYSSPLLITHASISYSDLFQIYYTCSGLMLILIWQRFKNAGYLFLAALLAGLGTFVKLEALMYLCVQAVLVLLILIGEKGSRKGKLKKFFQFVFIGLAVYLIYYFFKKYFHIASIGSLNFDFEWSHLSRLKDIIRVYAFNFFNSGNWSLVWFILLISLFRIYKNLHKIEIKLLVVGLGLFFCADALLGLLTLNFQVLFGEKSGISLSRLILHVFPLAPLLIVFLNQRT